MIIFYHIFEKVLVSVEYFDVLVRTTFFKANFNFKKIRQKKCFCIKFDGFYVITKKIKIVISRKAANWAFWWSRNTVLKIAITQKNLCPGLLFILFLTKSTIKVVLIPLEKKIINTSKSLPRADYSTIIKTMKLMFDKK